MGGGIADGKSLYIKSGVILNIIDSAARDIIGGPGEIGEVIDAEGNYVSPGFIDVHCHGGGGHDFMDGADALAMAAALHFRHGTTTLFPTTVACSYDALKAALDGMKSGIIANKTGEMGMERGTPHIYGAHLEGPYFSLNQAGAQNPKYITPPVPEDYAEIARLFGDLIKRWSFAPELPGGLDFCKFLTAHEIIPAIAHSDAVYDDVAQAYGLGCGLVTHLYSGTSTVTRKDAYRRPGVIEGAFLIDGMAVEVIADGHHLPPELLRLIYKIKGAGNICLVTDAMRAAGLPDGESTIGGLSVLIEGGVAKLPDRSAFAGSVATADRLVRVMAAAIAPETGSADASVAEAVTMMTETPARIMGLPNKGALKPGFDADIIIFDGDINIKRVIKGGLG